MPSLTWNPNIPNGPNLPSNDWSKMQANFTSINTIIDVDHFTFAEANAGLHTQVTMPTLGAKPTAPTNTGATIGSVYTNTVTRGAANTTEVFYVSDASGNPYQITQQINAGYSLFGKLTNNYTPQSGGGPVGVSFSAGWTFLPGGLILQFGQATVNTDTPIKFPVTFSSNPFSITVIGDYPSNSRGFWWVKTSNTTQFTTAERDSSGSDISTSIFWTAIGN